LRTNATDAARLFGCPAFYFCPNQALLQFALEITAIFFPLGFVKLSNSWQT
jgi:hypothetical protein